MDSRLLHCRPIFQEDCIRSDGNRRAKQLIKNYKTIDCNRSALLLSILVQTKPTLSQNVSKLALKMPPTSRFLVGVLFVGKQERRLPTFDADIARLQIAAIVPRAGQRFLLEAVVDGRHSDVTTSLTRAPVVETGKRSMDSLLLLNLKSRRDLGQLSTHRILWFLPNGNCDPI